MRRPAADSGGVRSQNNLPREIPLAIKLVFQEEIMKRALFVLVCGLVTGPVAAQTIRGALTGTVTDTTGAVVPGATVTVTNKATGISDSTASNAQGAYTFPLLQPGTYQTAAELQGFKKYVRDGVVVEVAQTTRLDIALQIGR
jgi:Carboxypeptidase regulatory-like domain